VLFFSRAEISEPITENGVKNENVLKLITSEHVCLRG